VEKRFRGAILAEGLLARGALDATLDQASTEVACEVLQLATTIAALRLVKKVERTDACLRGDDPIRCDSDSFFIMVFAEEVLVRGAGMSFPIRYHSLAEYASRFLLTVWLSQRTKQNIVSDSVPWTQVL